jgi:hypothetical protein
MPITTNSPSQRFETATIDEDGRAFLAWIDKRGTWPAGAPSFGRESPPRLIQISPAFIKFVPD